MRSLIPHSVFARLGGGRFWRSGRGGGMLMSTSSSPWLMLPPGRDSSSGDIIHNFYSLAEQKPLHLSGGFVLEDGTRFVGSSHGWLALFNAPRNHLFLTNPLSGRRIDLPPVENLTDPEINARVSKVVLSCSPDAGETGRRSARPAAAMSGLRSGYYVHPYKKFGRGYEDFVYCRPRESFICAPAEGPFESELEYWFVGDELDDPMMFSVRIPSLFEKINKKFASHYGAVHYIRHLIFVEQPDQNQLLVVRFVREMYPHQTVRFAVFKVDTNQTTFNDQTTFKGDSLVGLRRRRQLPLSSH